MRWGTAHAFYTNSFLCLINYIILICVIWLMHFDLCSNSWHLKDALIMKCDFPFNNSNPLYTIFPGFKFFFENCVSCQGKVRESFCFLVRNNLQFVREIQGIQEALLTVKFTKNTCQGNSLVFFNELKWSLVHGHSKKNNWPKLKSQTCIKHF